MSQSVLHHHIVNIQHAAKDHLARQPESEVLQRLVTDVMNWYGLSKQRRLECCYQLQYYVPFVHPIFEVPMKCDAVLPEPYMPCVLEAGHLGEHCSVGGVMWRMKAPLEAREYYPDGTLKARRPAIGPVDLCFWPLKLAHGGYILITTPDATL